MKVEIEVPILQWQRCRAANEQTGGSMGEFRLIEVATGRIAGSLAHLPRARAWSLSAPGVYCQHFLTYQQAMDWLRNVHRAPVRLDVLAEGEMPQPEVTADAR